MTSKSFLPGWARFLGMTVLFPLGLLPSLAFFAWIERGATLPILPIELGWPVVRFYHWPLPALIVWDLALILSFGAIHSGLAQVGAHRVLARMVPKQLIRLVYFAITGLNVWAVMALWQNTGIMLWSLPLDTTSLNLLSLAIYWPLIAVSAVLVGRHGALHFIGLEQLYRRGDQVDRLTTTPQLIQTGLYARVRHPLYTFTLLAVAAAPQMPLDRALILAGFGIYLSFGIPIEERKLVALFGDAYVKYRKRVPAVVPRLRAAR